MADPKGFIKYNRRELEVQSPQRRLQHFQEFSKFNRSEHSEEQASRCMDCGIPFCHNGCPLGNLIPDFNDAVYRQEWKLAYQILAQTNNFPEFTGRICPAPCEASCVLNLHSDAVTIEEIEKSIIETAFHHGWVQPAIPEQRRSQRVAIVGSGPAGLACADDLNQMGYSVTVFEKANRLGGLLRYGIPDFKLEKEVVDRRVDLMEAAGIAFKPSTEIGKDLSVQQLQADYDAIVLCGGSEMPRDLNLPGRDLKGVHFAMDFLSQNNRRVAGDQIDKQKEIKVTGQRVLVIGGGDTGSDCIGTSNRLRAESVRQIELLAQPPANRASNNPWPQWPMILRTSTSHQEGCERNWAISTKEFIGDSEGQLIGVKVIDVEWTPNKDGNYLMTEVPDSERVIECDLVFLAIGFLHPRTKSLLHQLKVEKTSRGNIATKEFQTSEPGIFAAGDMRRGQSLVVWAIHEGKQAALAVRQYLEKNAIHSLKGSLEQSPFAI
ncbi:MAG: glutamate synthase subunit beta [Bacteroidota bacterium]